MGDQFTYLGILLNFNGKFFTTQKQLASQGRKAMFALKSSISGLSLNHCSLLSLFDTSFNRFSEICFGG